MKAKGCTVSLSNNTGFTLPSNIGELGDDITELNLRDCSLQGLCITSSTQKLTSPRAGTIPESISSLTNLTMLNLAANKLEGESVYVQFDTETHEHTCRRHPRVHRQTDQVDVPLAVRK